jgi:D-glycero-alpha-D-manno-heptose 1-phosphate guanylyltransferase
VTCCLILAGGLGTRLRAAVPGGPKCLAPIGRRSFLEVQLRSLADRGVSRFVLSLGYLSDRVIVEADKLSGRFELTYIVEPEPLGTAGAVGLALSKLELPELLVANGDTLIEGNIEALLAPFAPEANQLVRLGVIEVPDAERFGAVQVRGALVERFVGKGVPGAGLINAGLFRVRRQLREVIAQRRARSLESDVLPHLASTRQLGAARLEGTFIDIGVPEDYQRCCEIYG